MRNRASIPSNPTPAAILLTILLGLAAPPVLKPLQKAWMAMAVVMGWFMTTDRLMRCGRDEMKRSRRVRINGQWLYYDPVEENDSWLTGKMAPSHQKVD